MVPILFFFKPLKKHPTNHTPPIRIQLNGILLSIFFLYISSSITHALPTATTVQDAESWQKKAEASPVRGWEFVANLLKESGLEEQRIIEVFSSQSLPTWTPILFKSKPKESKVLYRKHNTAKARAGAIQCFKQHKKAFVRSELELKVPREILASIIQVETRCGVNLGKERVLYWIARLVSTGFTPNIEHTLQHTNEIPKPTREDLEKRADWLKQEFFPHLQYLFKLADDLNISPLEIKGSYGGAIGIPQFLPLNIKRFGVDGDHNQIVDITKMEDAIPSVANFLRAHGWKEKTSFSEQKRVIRKYNNSEEYAKTIIAMARAIRKDLKQKDY